MVFLVQNTLVYPWQYSCNILIVNNYFILQRRGVLSIDSHNQQSNNQLYKQWKFVCTADIFMYNDGVLSPQLVKFVCVKVQKSILGEIDLN